MRWAVGVGAALVTAIGLVLIFLLAQATNNRALYERYYVRLFGINVVVAVLLVLVIGWVAFRLLRRLRQGKFGSRLLIKLAAIFALVGVVPGALVYVVSYQFVARSIESWFDVKVEGALDAGLNLGRATLDSLSDDLPPRRAAPAPSLRRCPMPARAWRWSASATSSRPATWCCGPAPASSSPARAPRASSSTPSGRRSSSCARCARARRSRTSRGWTKPPPGAAAARRERARAGHGAAPGLRLRHRAALPAGHAPLPPAVVANALAVQEANREYQERALAREGLRRMYIGTLTLSLFLAVFGAVLLAVLFGNQLARPLLVLADGVRQVAAGDLRPTAVLQGKDELGGLTRSFAVMTQQLADARGAVEKTMGQLDAARANLQTILDNLTSGVIVLDARASCCRPTPAPRACCARRWPPTKGRRWSTSRAWPTSAPRCSSSSTISRSSACSTASTTGSTPSSCTPPATTCRSRERRHQHRRARRGAARRRAAAGVRRHFRDRLGPACPGLGRGGAPPGARDQEPADAHPAVGRAAGDEALGQGAPPEQAMLVKSVKTIVDQVDAMKRLVNEFRDYARLPAADLKPVDLNALLADVLQLYNAESLPIALRFELDERCPPVRGDAQQIRQVIHNLLQNAQDAAEAAASGTGKPGEVVIRTRLGDSGQRVRLTVQDSGPGFAENILKRAFEPYVTTKTKGTGLGLAVVKKIADEHGARIELSNRVVDGAVAGAQVSLSFALASESRAAVAHTEDSKSSAA
jgi:nitrogen fixation/metabolism regulation signal transduction histidine kinase